MDQLRSVRILRLTFNNFTGPVGDLSHLPLTTCELMAATNETNTLCRACGAGPRASSTLIYTIFKSNVPYDENYQTTKKTNDDKKIRQSQNRTVETIENCPA